MHAQTYFCDSFELVACVCRFVKSRPFSILIFRTFYLHHWLICAFIFPMLSRSSFAKCHGSEIEQLSRMANARQSISPFESAVSARLENEEPLSKKSVFLNHRQKNTLQPNTCWFLMIFFNMLYNWIFRVDNAVTLKPIEMLLISLTMFNRQNLVRSCLSASLVIILINDTITKMPLMMYLFEYD